MSAIFILAAVMATAALVGVYRLGRKSGYKLGRWDGLEEGYADAMRDGWTEVAR